VAKSTTQNKIAKAKHQQTTTHLQKKTSPKWQNLPNNKQRTQTYQNFAKSNSNRSQDSQYTPK